MARAPAPGVTTLPAVKTPAARAVPPAAEIGHIVAVLRRGWVEACVAFDEQRAEVILNQASSLNLGVATSLLLYELRRRLNVPGQIPPTL